MKIVKLSISISLLLFMVMTAAAQTTTDYYTRGVMLRNQGKIPMALFAWVNGRNILAEEGKTDPRLAIAFIGTATQFNKKNYYPLASTMYLESMTRENFEKYPETFIEEAKRMMPLFMEHNKKKPVDDWKMLIENRDPQLAIEIKKYWIEQDREPYNEKNERLIEHWNRIGYSRNNFLNADNTIYGTDDRALFWIKYGKPDVMKRWKDPYTPGPYGKFVSIYYDIWIYRNLYADQEDSVIHGFGYARPVWGGDLRFRHLQTFEQLGASAEFYYRLSHLDEWFYDRYSYKAGQYSSHFITETDKHDPAKYDAPLEKSEMDDLIRPVNIISELMRFLSEDNIPEIAVVAMSTPVNMFSAHSVAHTLKIYDEDYNEIDQIEEYPEGKLDNVSFFNVEHKDSTTNYFLVARAFEEPVDSLNTIHIGRSPLEEKPPLDPNPELLELSDLITGIDIPEYIDRELFPYPIIPTKELYIGDPLKVYMEIYHLYLGSEGKAQYTIKYQIDKWRKKGFWYDVPEYRKREDRISRSSSYESLTRAVKEEVEFDISNIKPGKYVFTVEVTDLLSGQIKSRKGEFEIKEHVEKK
ncbi:MAG: GWxTD domain-containing protein [bacterium]|nr:GWxTD domain-containing protein [bacterium]